MSLEIDKILLMVSGVIVGGCAAGYALTKLAGDNADDRVVKKSDFDMLIANQKVCDELDGVILAEWFRKNKSKGGDSAALFIARPNEYTSRIFALGKIPADIDVNHNLLQVVANKKTFKVVAMRLVSFNSLNDEVSKLLGDKDYIIVEGG